MVVIIFFQLKPVLDGKLIVIEWHGGLSGVVYRRFSNPGSGKPLIHVSQNHIFTTPICSFGVKKMSPWAEQFSLIGQWYFIAAFLDMTL